MIIAASGVEQCPDTEKRSSVCMIISFGQSFRSGNKLPNFPKIERLQISNKGYQNYFCKLDSRKLL